MTAEKPSDDRVNQSRIPFPAGGKSEQQKSGAADERFTETEMQDILRDFSFRFSDTFRGLHNAEIARRCKTTDSVIKNYVEGKRLPTADMLLQIQKISDVNLNWLLTGKGSRRVESGDMFSEEEERQIKELAEKGGHSFSEQVRRLTIGAVEFLKKL